MAPPSRRASGSASVRSSRSSSPSSTAELLKSRTQSPDSLRSFTPQSQDEPLSIAESPDLQEEAHSSSAPKNANGSDSAAKVIVPTFDAKSLLSPKAAASAKRTRGDSTVDASSNFNVTDGQSNPNAISLIEKLHGVQERQARPTKKAKRAVDEEDDASDPRKKATFQGSGSGTGLGARLREGRDQAVKEAGPSTIVDLTADDGDDDDVVLVRDSGAKIVCLGRIERAYALVHQVPHPKVNFQGTSKTWPMIRCTMRRRPLQDKDNIIVAVHDAAGQYFGRLDPRVASGIIALLDATQVNGLTLEIRTEMRPRRPGEQPGQTVQDTIGLHIVLFAPKKMAERIGRYLSQKQIWLRRPVTIDPKIQYFNPHEIRQATTANGLTPGYASSGFVARTEEEIRRDVTNMFDELTKSEDLPEQDADPRITTDLLPHQRQALHFMLDKETNHEIMQDSKDSKANFSLWKMRMRDNGRRKYYNVITGQETGQRPAPVLGGILADEMGLGKTLSVLSVVVATLKDANEWANQPCAEQTNEDLPAIELNSRATLLVCPKSTVPNWKEQMLLHMKKKPLKFFVNSEKSRTMDVNKLANNDVVICAYDIFRSSKGFGQALQSIGWFRVVLDEAHTIRNTSTLMSVGCCNLTAARRWAVTGTPVQNKLEDLGALVKFLRIKPFDEKAGFAQYFIAPFKMADTEIIPKLRLLVDSITLRRQKDVISLPARRDYMVTLDFSDRERNLWETFKKDMNETVDTISRKGGDKGVGKVYASVLRKLLRLRQICAHGEDLLSEEDMKIMQGKDASTAIDLGDEDEEEKPALTARQAYDMYHVFSHMDNDECEICKRKLQPDDAEQGTIGIMTPCYQVFCTNCFEDFHERVEQVRQDDGYMECPFCSQYVRASFFTLTQEGLEKDEFLKNTKKSKRANRYTGPHTKTLALLAELQRNREWSDEHPREPPIKSVVFSEWTSHMDLIEIALSNANVSFTRLDGTMNDRARERALTTFQTSPDITVILVSIRAGGQGITLTAASRVYVMEPQYNPGVEMQAMDRVHRLGQTREVEVKRFVMKDSIDEWIVQLQDRKKELANMTMDRKRKRTTKEKLEELRSLFR